MGSTQAEAKADRRRNQEYFRWRNEIAAVRYHRYCYYTGSGTAYETADALERNRRRRETVCLTWSADSGQIPIPGKSYSWDSSQFYGPLFLFRGACFGLTWTLCSYWGLLRIHMRIVRVLMVYSKSSWYLTILHSFTFRVSIDSTVLLVF